MKAIKKAVALFLAVLLFVSAVPMSATAAFYNEVKENKVSLQNDYIKVTVNAKNGRFAITTVEGQPVRKKDQNSFLSFVGGLFGEGIGDEDTSFTTFRINGTDYIFGNRYTLEGKGVVSSLGETTVLTSADYEAIPEGCQAVVTPWSVEGVTIRQVLLLTPETDGENSGNVQIYYHIQNNSGANVQVGARILLDTMVGSNDGPELQIGTISSNTLRVERMLSPDPENDQGIATENRNYWTLPGYWVMKDTLDASNPLATNVIAYGYTDIAGYRDVDYMIVSHWNKLAKEKFEEFSDYVAVSAEQSEAAAEVDRTQRLAERAVAVAEQKEDEAAAKEEAAQGAEEGSKAQQDAQKAREDATRVRAAADKAVQAAQVAKEALARIGRTQVGSSIINPNLDFTDDKNDYGSADSAVALYWSGTGDGSVVPAGGTMQLGTVYGLGEIIDPTSVLAISFPDPVTQVEIDPNDQNAYKDSGLFTINVEVENLESYKMQHNSVDITMTLEKGLRFVKRDELGNIQRDQNGVPLTSYGSTQTVVYEKPLTPQQAAAGETNPILPGEKFAVSFTVMAQGKPWPTTREYMVTASSPQLEMEFETKYGEDAGEDVKALYNSSKANFVMLPAVGSGTPSYATSINPEECFTTDPKYITVNLTNIEAYNPGSSVRGQEASPNFNLFFEEIVTGKRYQIDVIDNVQCIVTDDGLTGDMRISYTNGTLVDQDGMVLQLDTGCELPVGEYRVEIDYISTDEEENAMLDVSTQQTFLVTQNEEARVRTPAILAVVKETVDFDDSELMQKITDLVAEVEAAVNELQEISEKLTSTDFSDAIYDEVVDFAKELVSPVTQIYDNFEKLTDFTRIEADMRELAKSYPELADVDFSSLRDFDVGAAIKGVSVDVSLSEEFKKKFDIESLLLGPLGLDGLSDLAEGGVDGLYESIKDYGKNALAPITDIYQQIASLGDLSSISEADINQLKASFTELQDVDFSALKNFSAEFKTSIGLKNTDQLVDQFKKIIDIDSILAGPLGENGVGGIYDSIVSYGEDMVKPIQNLYQDLLELTDFSTLTEEEFAELKKAYGDLEGLDLSQIKSLGEELGKFISGTEVNVNLSGKFKAMVDVETLVKGPFGGNDGAGVKESVYNWLQGYAKKAAAPILSIYSDFEDLADFSNIGAEMQELSKTYKELEGIDFSCLADFDLGELIDGLDINVGLSDKFKELFDYEAILAGPFSGSDGKSAMDVLEERITDYGKRALSPVLSIYSDIEGLANFDGILADMKELSGCYDELKGVDFSCLADFDVEGAIRELYNGTSVDLSEGFQQTVQTITAGPLDNGSITETALTNWINAIMGVINDGKSLYELGQKAYNKELSVTAGAQQILALYKKYVNSSIDADFDAAISEAKKTGAQTWNNGKKLALAFVAMYAKLQDIYSGLQAKYSKAKGVYDDVVNIKNRIVRVVQALGSGDLSALFAAGEDAIRFVLGEWLDPVENAYNSGMALYGIGRRAYNRELSIKEGAGLLVDFCEKYLDLSISVDPGKTNIEAGKAAYSNSEKLTLAFMAMYARMQNIYSGLQSKVQRANEVYSQAKSMVNTVVNVVTKLANGDLSDLTGILASAGKDLFENVLKAWLDPVMDTIHSAQDLYAIGEKAYSGKLSAKQGAKLLMDFYESYLDVDVKADLSGLQNAAEGAYTQGQKVAAAFMVMYARLQQIYQSMERKVERAVKLYNQAKSVINSVVKLVKAIGSGDLSDLAGKLLEMGTDIVSTVIQSWLDQIQHAIDSVQELYEIGKHAYQGNLSINQGAQLLIDFYENYLDVSVSADFRGAGEVADQAHANARKVADAFKVMYAQMRKVYSTVSTKVETVKNVYNQAKSIVNTIIKLVSDPMAAVSDLVDMGKDKIFEVLNAYLDKINEMVDGVKEIYEIGKKAYQGKLDIREGAELLIGFCEKYLDVSISADLEAVGDKNAQAATKTLELGKKMALAFMAMYARMKNLYSSISSKVGELTNIYDEMMEIVETVKKLFTDPASGAFALMDLVKARIMNKLEGLGMYRDMFLQVLDVLENFDQFDPGDLMDEAMNFAVTTARVKADQVLYSSIYGMLVTAATKLDPESDYEWSPGDMKKSLPTYQLRAFADEAEFQEYEKEMAEKNKKKKDAVKDEKEKAQVGNDGVMVKINGIIRQLGEGTSVSDYIVDTSSEPAIINNTVAFKGGDLVFTNGKLKISFGDVATIDAGEYISKAQQLYGSETPLFDTLIVSGNGQLYIEGSGFVFHEGEWSLDFYNGFDKILDPVETEEKKEEKNAESDALNETAAWAVGALNDLFNPLKALAITDVYFNRHTLFSAPNFSVAGFGLKFDNYLLRSNEVCFGGHIDFKIVTGEIQNVFFNSSGLQSIEADLKFDLGGDLGLLEKGETAGGNLSIHYYDPDYLQSFRERGYTPPTEKYSLDFNAQLKKIGGVGVQLSFKRVADGRILPDIIGFQATPPEPGILVTGGTYLTQLRGAIKELADTIAGGSSTVPLTIEAGVDIKFGQAPAVFDGKIDMILKMTGIEFNGVLGYKNKPMITQAQIKAQWVTPWFVSASMEMDVLGLNIIIGKARLFIGQNLEKDRIDFEGFVSAALQIPSSVPVVGGFQLGQVSFGLNNDKIWGSASVGVTPIAVGVGITYYWNGGIEFGTSGESLPEAYTYLLLERPEEEPVLVAIGSGMRTEATSWVNEDTLHTIEYHSIGDGVSYLDNGQNDIGLGGIEVSNEGKTHLIPVGSVAEDRDALIEVEYYGESLPALTLTKSSGGNYPIQVGDMNDPKTGDSAFLQELVTEDGVNRHLLYIMVPRSQMGGSDSFTLTASERVQTKLLSTPISSSLGGVTLTGSGTQYTANVTVANAHEGDTVSLYLTKEKVGTAVETVTTENGQEIPVTEDKDPGVMICEGIPVPESGTVTQAFDLANITGAYAVEGLGDIRQLLESGQYYLRAALKSDTAYDAKTSDNAITLEDPKAPGAVASAALSSAGNGYFDLTFPQAAANDANAATSYRVDFCDENGELYPNYNGLLFDTADLTENLKDGVYTLRLGGWTVTGGEGTESDPYTYSGLETGKKYTVKVYAASQTGDGNYHYAAPAVSAVKELPLPQYVTFTGIQSQSGTMGLKKMADSSGGEITTSSKELITNQAAPELTLTTSAPAAVEAYNGDALVGTMDESGKLVLTGLTSDGEYAIELRAKNSATGDLSVTVLYVIVDTIEPTILITEPTGETVNFNGVRVSGQTEPGSRLTGNNTAFNVEEDGSFAGVVSLNNALTREMITLTATDAAGNTNTAVVSVVNSNISAPVGINVVRTGTMKLGNSQSAQVYLKYPDGKTADGTQKYRSVRVPASDRSRLSFDVVRGDAITVDDAGKIQAVNAGASLMSVSYQVNEYTSLDTTVPVLVEETTQPQPYYPSSGGDTPGGSTPGGDAPGGDTPAPTTADVVINGKSKTVEIDSDGKAAVRVTKDDAIDTKETLTVSNLTPGAAEYALEVDAAVAKKLSGQSGQGVSFSGGGTQIDLPGSALTGSALSVALSPADAGQRKQVSEIASKLKATVLDPGASIQLSGTQIQPGDRILTQLEIPVGVDPEKITALVYVDADGNYTNLPWKLTVAGSTAYAKFYLPGSGTVALLSSTTAFSDVPEDFWGAAAIAKAAGQMVISGYPDGTFRPYKEVTRAEYTSILLRSVGLMTAPHSPASFTDVKKTDWCYNCLSIGAALGIIAGYQDGTVLPNKQITRVEGMAIASRILKLMHLGEELSDDEAEQILAGFLDQDQIPKWARKDVALCIKQEIIVGSKGALNPKDPLTRAQAAVIATKLMDAISDTM